MKPLVLALLLASATPALADEVLWDRHGVPHIIADSEAGAFKGFGWAQAASHGNILLKMYGESRARAAEYWGPEHAALDRYLIAHDVPERAQAWYKAQAPQMRANLDAFAAGINAWMAAHPDHVPAELRRVLPITGVDVMAHAHRLMQFLYVAPMGRMLSPPSRPGPTGLGDDGGSNGWAVAPRRTVEGAAMLLANPHLPWAPSPLTYYEAQITAPGYNVYGATQVGLPVLRFAFNNELGFTNTVNNMLGATRYALVADCYGYRLDGKRLAYRMVKKAMLIRQSDGSLKRETWAQRHSVHGPVFEVEGKPVAVRVAGLDRPGVLQAYLDMGKAKDFNGFESALKRLQIPSFNIVYADRAGHVFHISNGILPRHKTGGSHEYWSGLVPGDRSALISTEIEPYDSLPKALDPPGGFVQNANDVPWVNTVPRVLKPADFPAHVAATEPMSLRAQMSARLLMGDDRLSFAEFQRRKLTTTSLMAERLKGPLLAASAGSADPDVRAARDLLAGWDNRFEADSRAAILFEEWARRFAGPGLSDEGNYTKPWTLEDPLNTPAGIRDDAQATAMLAAAAQAVKARHGRIDPRYGDVSRFAAGEALSVPGHGGAGPLGLFRTISWGPWKDGTRVPVAGETWVNLIQFSTPMKAIATMSYGNSSQPGTPHRSDQLAALGEKRFRQLWLTRDEVERNLERRDVY
ncbi:acylase [Sandarakinorhabdus cyanobacteriorum]|uniref:Acylase n=1 Tax=Sandarakinorhabdus cyanobacteriorum TaxID=1981098 RepID=A0A255YYX5_9SPHN|nr:penicillin acylase family protein [Sandarakinorhabdus cyanobacteriorum]OYQ33874.1 acylase [Sandarakinorhabdus cyanobacteriorum]